MIRRSALFALVALGLVTAGRAMAQPGLQQPNRGDPGVRGARPAMPPGQVQRGDAQNRPGVRRDDRYGPNGEGRADQRPGIRRDDRYGPDGQGRADVRSDRRGDGRGAGPDHAFRPGGRLPPAYRSRHYVVDDWRAHRLTPPPRGYHWVQVGADYVLVAIATGIILQMILGY